MEKDETYKYVINNGFDVKFYVAIKSCEKQYFKYVPLFTCAQVIFKTVTMDS